LHREIGFDLTHHATFVKYWRPSLLPVVSVPFVWGPIGGAESAPGPFWDDFRWRGKLYEVLRAFARWSGERDPLVSRAARRSAVAVAVTPETAARLRALGSKRVWILGEAALGQDEIARLGQCAMPPAPPHRFISMGRLLHWKGFHLALQAFAAAGIVGAEYWLLGDGPEASRLQRLAESLGIAASVRFWGGLPRTEVLAKLAQAHVAVHPSLHDSGGWVCLEAMAAGRPVICLDLGGPGQQVTHETGIKIRPHTPRQVVEDLAHAMVRLANDPSLRMQLGSAGKERVASQYSWEGRGELLGNLYQAAVTLNGHMATGTRVARSRPC
jgi:glycosyltransferase involved in cell wall biosynthesis